MSYVTILCVMVFLGYESTLQHSDLSIDMGVSTVRLASNHGRIDLGLSGLASLTRRFQNTPDVYRIHLLHLVIRCILSLIPRLPVLSQTNSITMQ